MEHWYLEKEIWDAIKLPRLSYFRSVSKNKSPLDKLYGWTVNRIYPMANILWKDQRDLAVALNEKGFNVSHIWVHEKDYKKLEEMVTKWAMVTNKASRKRVKPSLSWYMLGYAPGEFREEMNLPEWAQPGYVYVRKVGK